MANEKERPTKAPVVASDAKVKKTLGKKFKEAFTHDDVESVGDYLLFSVLIPAVKDMVSDFVRNATDIFLYGSGGGRTSKGGKTNLTYLSKVSFGTWYCLLTSSKNSMSSSLTTFVQSITRPPLRATCPHTCPTSLRIDGPRHQPSRARTRTTARSPSR